MTHTSSPSMSRQVFHVGVLLLSLGAIGVALYSLTVAFRVFDIHLRFWSWFGLAMLMFLFGLLGLEFSAERIKTM